jgi:adenylate cyclase
MAPRGAAVNAGKGSGNSNPEKIPADLIQAQLERIIASSAFDASRRNRAFLRFVVEETLAGRGDRIKAYTIGTSVLQRDAGFDPQADPIVRIEASRLRRSLEHYYLVAGKDDPIRIDIPKWGYVASFQRLSSVGEDGAPHQDTAAPELPQRSGVFSPDIGRRKGVARASAAFGRRGASSPEE